MKDPRTEHRFDPEKRVVCVRSMVENGDAQGHAVMGYAEWMAELSTTSKGKVRAQVRLQLATTFADICGIDEIDWPWTTVAYCRRMLTYAKNLLSK